MCPHAEISVFATMHVALCEHYVVLSVAAPPVVKRDPLADRETSEAIRLVNAGRLQRTDLRVRRDLPPNAVGLAGSGNELEVAQVAVVFGVVCNQWCGQNQSGGGDQA